MTSISIRVDGVDQAGEARRAAAGVAATAGLDETTAGKLAIVVTECANNLWKHAGGGEIVLTPAGAACVEVLALDKGPGIRNVELCFQDGYSTAGSAGTGLGAVRRLAAEIDIYTVPDKGTALLARVAKAPFHKGGMAVGGVSVPIRGESMCGDDFVVMESPGGTVVLVVDGLGHGPVAADCATAAVEAFRESAALEAPPELMREVHGALRGTRGAAVAIGTADWRRGELRYCGIGNIARRSVWQKRRVADLLSHPGIVGHDVRNVRDITYELGSNGTNIALFRRYFHALVIWWVLRVCPASRTRR